ncbi:MAG: hypothetical protein QM765_35340 [Myxococcales bacterium]
MSCPSPEELFRWVDGDSGPARSAELGAHVQTCAACAAECERQRQVLARVAAPLPGAPSPGALDALMRRLDQAPSRAPEPQRLFAAWRWVFGGLGAAAAATAVALLVLARPVGPPDGMQARGSAVEWSRKVGVDLHVLERPLRKLTPGATLRPGTALTASYRNLDARDAYLLAFGIDAQGEIHWLYPAFTDPQTDPQAVALPPANLDTVLGDSVALDELPPGPLRLITLLADAPLHVSAIEGLPVASRSPEALRARWPQAALTERTVQVESP